MLEGLAGPGEPERRRTCWSASAAVWVAWAALALAYSLWGSAALDHSVAVIRVHRHFHHVTPWMQSGDSWSIIDAARYVWYGALGYVYQTTSATYALPLSFILSAPVAGLIDHFHLVEGAPYPVAEPSAWLLVAPYSLAYGLPLLVALRRVAWDLGARRKLWALQVACVPLALLPAFFWGHFEDLLALTFVLWALRRLFRRQWLAAALLLSLAIASKQWAVMLVPLLVVLTPAGKRLRALAAAAALPAALALFVLGVDWHDASKALLFQTNAEQVTQGHMAFYATWLGTHTSMVSRTLGMLAAVPAAWLMRRSRLPAELLAAASVLLFLRPVSEAISFSYYWTPALLLAGLVGLHAHRSFRVGDWAAPVAAVLWATPRVAPAAEGWWWAGELVLLGLVAIQVFVNCGLGSRFAALDRLGIKKKWYTPIVQPMTTARALGDTSWSR